MDLDLKRHAIEGVHVDENEYHMGLLTHRGDRKPAYAHWLAAGDSKKHTPRRSMTGGWEAKMKGNKQ